jgi:hypothetical protein
MGLFISPRNLLSEFIQSVSGLLDLFHLSTACVALRSLHLPHSGQLTFLANQRDHRGDDEDPRRRRSRA